MRELPLTLVVSLALHGAALAWFATDTKPPSVVRPTRSVEILPVVEAEPVVVLLLDHSVKALPEVAGTEPIAVPTRRRDTPRRVVATSTLATIERPPAVEPPSRTALKTLSMRRPGDREPQIHRPGGFGISDAALDAMLN